MQAQVSNITNGTTPAGIAPGAPAGSYPLTEIEVINIYNGNLSLRLPLYTVGGRGSVTTTLVLTIQQRWTVDHFQYEFDPVTYHSPSDSWWFSNANRLNAGGRMLMRQVSEKCSQQVTGAYMLTRLTFSAPDGTEYELRDVLTDGEKKGSACDLLLPKFNRGKIFKTADGTSATFISDVDIYDASSYTAGTWPVSGYLMLRDGTRYRIDDGYITWMRDANGNKITFSSTTGQTTITDPLNRSVMIVYDINHP